MKSPDSFDRKKNTLSVMEYLLSPQKSGLYRFNFIGSWFALMYIGDTCFPKIEYGFHARHPPPKTAHAHIHMHACARALMHMQTHTHTSARTPVCAHACEHTRTHIHKNKLEHN